MPKRTKYKAPLRLIILLLCLLVLGVPLQDAAARPLEKVIYDDCLKVQYMENKRKGKQDKDAKLMAHYYCKIGSGFCKKPDSEMCKSSVRGFDMKRGDSGPSKLYVASEKGKISLVRKLLQIGYNPNAPLGGPGWTPLMIATAEGHADVVKVLLDAKADTNARNNQGRTALMFASSKGYKHIVELLLSSGADKTIKDNQGVTAESVANSKGHTEIVQLLK